jgi:phage gp46-like protein
MWRQDHASAIRYIEALLEEWGRWSRVIEKAKEYAEARRAVIVAGRQASSVECYARQQALRALEKAIANALKESAGAE